MLASLVLIVSAGWLLRRLRRPPAAPARRQAARGPFHAVTIVPGREACARACHFSRRDCAVLSRDAPRLPLEGCDRETCGCRYAHHADRRRRIRRAADRGWPARAPGSAERRVVPDRRRDEHAPS